LSRKELVGLSEAVDTNWRTGSSPGGVARFSSRLNDAPRAHNRWGGTGIGALRSRPRVIERALVMADRLRPSGYGAVHLASAPDLGDAGRPAAVSTATIDELADSEPGATQVSQRHRRLT
jgi:hypothetical protein